MIPGNGSDLIDIRRFEKTLERFEERFTYQVFTEVERTKSNKRAASCAKRFALREACSKALGSGIRMDVALRETGIAKLASSKPAIALMGGGIERLQAVGPSGFRTAINQINTDDYPLAQASAVISARPGDRPEPPKADSS
ncbi:holo-[acyl-carrier-protein] synthase [Stappia sp. BW2]|uniref:holo-ACP synthase n=1 Tax=Stappia sp. BW2 TaxID=2592622 RepID=UPI0011DEDAAC|nr:holo-ACP synthase [Stappia sp. BW2]TYC66982.1 holo-[acyl-carrier-protein] synthase [Stappia sp. BW2]